MQPAEKHKAAPTKERSIHVIQGEYKISSDANTYLTTILGSCVAVCLRDPTAGVGGMNHFLLPFGDEKEGDLKRFGAYAMELLINKLLRHGAERHRLEAKVFGGANMNAALHNIGIDNVNFARRFLQIEEIDCISESVGGNKARRLRYWPVSGRARQLLISDQVQLPQPEKPKLPEEPKTDDIEFF